MLNCKATTPVVFIWEKTMKFTFATVTTLAMIAGFSAANAADDTISATLKEEDKRFVAVMGPVEFADAFGSRETGPHGTFGSFPAGFATPEHIHSHGYRAIVTKGEMTNPFGDEANPPVLKPGSYWAVAAGEAHVTACVSAIPCEFFMFSNDGFDFVTSE
jgi:hypothetical protein